MCCPCAHADADTLARVLRLAVERKRLERAARKAYATDLATGLPNHAQLLEHMTHLLALREREPAPMALLVLRIEGLATAEATLGAEAANVLRRKVAVRLRAGLRASDVVASIGADALRGAAGLDRRADRRRARGVASWSQSLQQPFNVAGPRAGRGRRASGVSQLSRARQAGRRAAAPRHSARPRSTAAVGRGGFANRVERGDASAANDEGRAARA